MKLIDIANRIDKSDKNKAYVHVDDLASELNVDLDWAEQDRITAYWVGNWYCTDSYVGYRMYFFDDELMAFSTQLGRKCDEDFHWISEEMAEKVREYLLTLLVKEEDEISVNICDFNQEVGDGYRIDFNRQVLPGSRPTLNGEPVEIVKYLKNSDLGIDTLLLIKLPNGKEQEIDIRKLKFGFYVNEEEDND